MIGAVVNIALTLAFVPFFGIMGAAGATAVSYAVIAIVRARDTRKFVKLDFRKGEIITSFALIGAQVVLSCVPFSPAVLALEFVLFAVVLVVLREGLVDIVRMGAKAIRNRK